MLLQLREENNRMVIQKTSNFLFCIAEENALNNGRELSFGERDVLLQNPNYVLDYSMIDEDSD